MRVTRLPDGGTESLVQAVTLGSKHLTLSRELSKAPPHLAEWEYFSLLTT